MIQIRYNANFEQKFDSIENFVQNFPEVVLGEVQKIMEEEEAGNNTLIGDLTYEPPRSGDSPNWYSEAQKRAAFKHMRMADRFSRETGYERSGDNSDGWTIVPPVATGTGILLIVRNTTGYSRFVQGDLSKRGGFNGLRHQQPFHRDTGWIEAYPIIVRYMNQIVIGELLRRMGDRITEFSHRTTSRGTQVASSFTSGKLPEGFQDEE